MTTKELTEIVTANSLALAEHTKAMAEINKAIAQQTQNSLLLHESVKSLEKTALAHDAQIDAQIENQNKLIESVGDLQKQWQAYINTLLQELTTSFTELRSRLEKLERAQER
jgi:hypothetical protein